MKKVFPDKIINIENTDTFDNNFLFDYLECDYNSNKQVEVIYLSDLLEDESAQVSGLKFYPDPTSQSHYIVRRAGTMQHLKFKAQLSRKYPPDDLLNAEQRQEQRIEMQLFGRE